MSNRNIFDKKLNLQLITREMKLINSIIGWFEKQAFGVCEYLGNKLGIRTTKIRMYFIYLSFFTFGSPVILYFIMAFMLEHRNYFRPSRSKKNTIWDF
jgi:phage shock protein C